VSKENLPKDISSVIAYQTDLFDRFSLPKDELLQRNKVAPDLSRLDILGLPADYLLTASEFDLTGTTVGALDLGNVPFLPIVDALLESNTGQKIPYGIPKGHSAIASVDGGILTVVKGLPGHDRSEIYHTDHEDLDKTPPIIAPDMRTLIVMFGLAHAAGQADMNPEEIITELKNIFPGMTEDAEQSWKLCA